MYLSFSQAFASLNQKLVANNLDPISESEAKEFGISDDVRKDYINDVVREIRSEHHTNLCIAKDEIARGDFDHLSNYDS